MYLHYIFERAGIVSVLIVLFFEQNTGPRMWQMLFFFF